MAHNNPNFTAMNHPAAAQAKTSLSQLLQKLTLESPDTIMRPVEPPAKRQKLDASPSQVSTLLTISEEDKANNQPGPVEWVWEDEDDVSVAHIPGTAAYYKSLAYRKKHPIEDSQNARDQNAMDVTPKLVMIFSRTNVRRASMHGKIYSRMQRYNRRAQVDPFQVKVTWGTDFEQQILPAYLGREVFVWMGLAGHIFE